MKKTNLWIRLTILTIICLGFINSSYGQAKVIRPSSKTKMPKNMKISFPEGYVTLQNEDKNNKTFSPNTIASTLLHKAAINDFVLSHLDKRGLPAAIIGSINYDRNTSRTIKAMTFDHLKAVEKIMQIDNVDEEFLLIDNQIDDLNMRHVTLNQQYKGVPVYGGQIKLHGDLGAFNLLNGHWHPTPKELDVQPKLNLNEAEGLMYRDIGEIKAINDHLNIFNYEEAQTDLVVYFDDLGQAKLAYHSIVYKSLLDRWEYFIDGHNGAIIKKYESICKFHNHDLSGVTDIAHSGNSHSKSMPNNSMFTGHIETSGTDLLGQTRTLNTYEDGTNVYMIDTKRDMFVSSSQMPDDPAGSIWTIDAFNTSPQKDNFNYDHVVSSSTVWDNPVAVSAHYNGARAYEYFISLHTRNSINGSGGNIISIINVADEDGNSMENAFWNGQAMFYGNGGNAFKPLARGLDVAGHEMTHGVVQSTANLEYQGESGALNESFADVFGTMIDRDDWVIGEDVVNVQAFPSGALRSLSDPHNGAATGDYGSGWQPSHYSEKYTGSQDNGGVHINSGIPNHAFFLFASNNAVGIEKAEQVYYRALSMYLTRSSQFVDAKIAVVRAAMDLYGQDIADIATQAFESVGIAGSVAGDYEVDVEENEGRDLILWTDVDEVDNNDNIYLGDRTLLQFIFNPLTENDPISKPSVTDNGKIVVFVSTDGKIHYINIDYNAVTTNEQVLGTGNTTWRNAIISKDGKRLAALSDDYNNSLVVFDLATGAGTSYELFIPTTAADNTTTGDVEYADAMEFDITGEFVMYDALNKIQSQSSGDINYWDISFIKVWDNKMDDFTDGNKIDKLFANLPEGITIGNPAFSKNSPHIIAFDYYDEEDFLILGTNLETGDVQVISENINYGYPNYSKNDDEVIFDVESFLDGTAINVVSVDGTKIKGETEKAILFDGNSRWGVRFSDGTRVLTSNEEEHQYSDEVILAPNPARNLINVSFESVSSGYVQARTFSIDGQLVQSQNFEVGSGQNNLAFDIEKLSTGTYFLKLVIDGKIALKKFVKM